MTQAARLVICGTGSNVGKSLVVAGLCRSLARRALSVAPFKAQNMSLNSYVTSDGGEIGRAQAAQAQAARCEPHVDMNPVLLKPGAGGRSQVVVLGHPVGEVDGWRFQDDKPALLDTVVDAFDRLAADYDMVICEGAGSAAEINLRRNDLVNLGLARAIDAPVVLVGDIDRGGIFAAFLGTLACLDTLDAACIRGFIVNRFRGDGRLLQPGLDELYRRTLRSTFGVVPHTEGLTLDAEDSLSDHPFGDTGQPLGAATLRVGVVALPSTSNLTDLDPLGLEPGVSVRLLHVGEEVADTDLVVIPGSRAVMADLDWMRDRRFPRALTERAVNGRMTVGICGGYQLLGEVIEDDGIESDRGRIEGLGLLPVRTRFVAEKLLRQHRQPAATYNGYEIRHGRIERSGGEPWFDDEGCRVGGVVGSSWHGLFDNDSLRRAVLTEAATRADRPFIVSPDLVFAEVKNAYYDRIGDLIDQHVDVDALIELAGG